MTDALPFPAARSAGPVRRAADAALSRFTPTVTIAAYLFLFVPIAVLIVYSFNASRSTVVWTGFTLDWYREVLADRSLQRALWVSAVVAGASALLSTVIGTLTALVLARRTFRGRDGFSTLVLAPLVLPEIVLAVGFLVLMAAAGIPLGYFTLIAGHTLIAVPFTTLIVRAAAAALDRRLEEAAADLGADGRQTFFRVTLPLLLPAIVTAFLLAATLSFDNFVMSTFTSGVGTTTLPLRIYSMLKTGITPEINALGTLLVAANILVVVAVAGRHLKLLLKR
ncbi:MULTISPECIES: ABC transporter permease [Inquilinus]|uniref:ABC-type spermidine/putrescine transport system permease subunit II n=1 Tax=Inquilinus ginsengisoli TaxID=363840 RepID=A0ABU1JJY9_9PROT|nr:ABC transporter permease [Inquilinus ginsengisoli]MDR6288642.1 ABC-type spermidine/putrescine transport system permease subunit II [Inquilinus ginsengisoli]